MAKSKTFESQAEGPVTIYAGTASFSLEPGERYETDDPAVIEALKQNPDLVEAKGGSSSTSGDKKDK